jgi:hypothetical protein
MDNKLGENVCAGIISGVCGDLNSRKTSLGTETVVLRGGSSPRRPCCISVGIGKGDGAIFFATVGKEFFPWWRSVRPVSSATYISNRLVTAGEMAATESHNYHISEDPVGNLFGTEVGDEDYDMRHIEHIS